jgi:hypothetical protein
MTYLYRLVELYVDALLRIASGRPKYILDSRLVAPSQRIGWLVLLTGALSCYFARAPYRMLLMVLCY